MGTYGKPLDGLDNEKFVDLVIYAWVCWTSRAALDLRAASAGDVMGIVSSPDEARYELPLTDDQHLLVDLRYSQLAKPHRRDIHREYFGGGYTEKQLKKYNLTRYGWRLRLRDARLAMYGALLPQIEDWRP